MPRATSSYRCQQCGFASPKPGTCPDCKRATGELMPLVEERAAPAPSGRRAATVVGTRPVTLAEVVMERGDRTLTGIGELDRVLGGGVVRGSLVLIGGDPGIGKCVTGDTRVLDPTSGAYRPIEAWGRDERPVLAVGPDTLRFAPAPISAFHANGTQRVVELRTTLGRTLRCTPHHPLLTVDGWREVSKLAPGERIAAPRALPYFGRERLADEAVKLIAYVLSDGSAQSSISVTTELAEVADDLAVIAQAFGMRLVSYDKPNNKAREYRFVNDVSRRGAARRHLTAALHAVKIQQSIAWEEWARRAGVSSGLLNAWRRGQCVPSETALHRLSNAVGVTVEELAPAARHVADAKTPIARFLEELGVRYVRASDKAVPDIVFRLSREQIQLFLRALFTCDGSVYVNRQGQLGVSYSTISRRLAEDVQHLLLRLGFVATLRTKRTRLGTSPYTSYELILLGVSRVRDFIETVGLDGRDGAKRAIAAMEMPDASTTARDTIPTGQAFWSRLQNLTAGAGFAEMSRRAGVALKNRRHDRPLCRTTVACVAAAYPDSTLDALAHGEVYWDEIVEIVDAGEAPVFDLSVPGAASFVANDLVVHNSTLILQAARALARVTPPVLYVCAEESTAQVKMRAERLGVAGDGLLLWAENDLSVVQAELDTIRPRALVVDSIQTVFLPELESAPGSVAQVRECGARLMTLAKGRGIATFLVGHVTKEGALAGPRVLEHLVDTVLYFEGEHHHAYRVLRAVKNRFGSTNEIGVFEMAAGGLIEVPNPSGFFLAERPADAPGSVIVAALEGTRPLLLELQALVVRASFGTPRRTVLGADYNRVCLLLAVLEKRAGLPIGNQDVFVNVAGGGRVVEPAADLGVVIAAASSYLERPVAGDVLVLGEVGLTGEVRAVSGVEARLRAAAQLGFKSAIVPRSNVEGTLPLPVTGVGSVSDALGALLG